MHDRVLLVVLEGASLDDIRPLARAGRLPVLESVLAAGVGGEVRSSRESASAEAVLRVITSPTRTETGPVTADPPAFWQYLDEWARPYAVIGFPGTEFRMDDVGLVAAGPNPGRGFVGSSTGVVLGRRAIERGPLPWPYSDERKRLQDIASTMQPGTESEWVEWQETGGESARVGLLKAYRLDDETFYVTPIYLRYSSAGDLAPTTYVADDPSEVHTTSRATEYLPRHARTLADARAALALRVLTEREWDLFVYVDRRLAFVRNAHPGDEDDVIPSTLTEAYEELDELLGRALTDVGDRTVALLVGLSDTHRRNAGPLGWYAVAHVNGDLGSWGPASAEDLSSTLAYLLSIEPAPGQAAISAVTTRFPLRTRFALRRSFAVGSSAPRPATGRDLRELSQRVVPLSPR
jgi:hypothetical protein